METENNTNDNVNENENQNNNVDNQELINKLNEQIALNEKLSRTKEGLLADLQDKKSKLNEFQSKAQNEQEQEALKKGDIDFIVNQRLESQKSQYEEVLNNIKSEKEKLFEEVNTYKSQIERNTVEQQLMKAAQNTDIRKNAMQDVIDYALRNGEVKEGKIIFKDRNGNPKTVNSRGETYTEKDFFDELRNEKDYFFESVNGTNTKGGSGAGVKEMTQQEYTSAIMNGSDQEAQDLAKQIATGKIILI
jgi:hypothetical protein